MQQYLRLFYDAASQFVSLSDVNATSDNDGGVQPGDGTPKPVDLSQVPPVDPANPAPPVDPKDEKKPEGSAPDDKKPEEGAEPDEDEEETSFWEDVDKLRGTPLKVEYPEGVEPESPEGAYHREKAVEKEAIDKFETYLKETNPRGYAYLLHIQAGGDDKDFFTQKTFSLPEYEAFKTNADLHTRILKASYISKGLDEDSAQTLIDKAIKGNKLFELADAEYKAAQKSQTDELAALEAENSKAEKEYQTSINSFNQQLVSAVTEGKGMRFIIPDTERAEFLNYVRNSTEYDKATKKFLIVQPVEKETLDSQLEALYYRFKKGDLKSLIQREAQTQNQKRLKKTIDKSKTGQTSGTGDPKQKDGFIALGDI